MIKTLSPYMLSCLLLILFVMSFSTTQQSLASAYQRGEFHLPNILPLR